MMDGWRELNVLFDGLLEQLYPVRGLGDDRQLLLNDVGVRDDVWRWRWSWLRED